MSELYLRFEFGIAPFARCCIAVFLGERRRRGHPFRERQLVWSPRSRLRQETVISRWVLRREGDSIMVLLAMIDEATTTAAGAMGATCTSMMVPFASSETSVSSSSGLTICPRQLLPELDSCSSPLLVLSPSPSSSSDLEGSDSESESLSRRDIGFLTLARAHPDCSSSESESESYGL